MATQMFLIIGLFVFVGLRLDDWLQTKVVFVLLGSLTGVGLALYIFIRDALNDQK